jgi:hypothetical protein
MILCVLAAAIISAGCGTAPVIIEKANKDSVFLYGYIDTTEYASGKEMTGLNIKQITPPTDDPYLSVKTVNGYFYNDKLLPGIYCLDNCMAENWSFTIPVDLGCLNIKKKGGIRYFGSYMIVRKPSGVALKLSENTDEAAVIAQMLKMTIKGTTTEIALSKRLKVLQEAKQRKKNIPHVE